MRFEPEKRVSHNKPAGSRPYRTYSASVNASRATDMFYRELRIRVVKVFNLLMITLPFALCWLNCYADQLRNETSLFQNAGAIVLFMLLYFFFARAYDAFLISLKRISELLFSQLLSILFADLMMLLVFWVLAGKLPSLLSVFGVFVGQMAASLLWCVVAHRWYFRHFGGLKTAVIYDVREGVEMLFNQYGLEKKFEILFSRTVEECFQDELASLKGLEAVFLCGVHSHDRNLILKYCIANHITAYIIPRIGDVIMSGAARMPMFHLPFLRSERYNPAPEFVIVKRVFDIISSSVMILVTSPLMLAIAIAIKLDDGGPVFYRQTRLTKNGREFQILKFRSMSMDAECDGVARLSNGDTDKRITRVGHFIRKCRLDELPQFFNILTGEMSVVGPRPERPEIAAKYEREIPEFALRLQAKAGLTGYAQVYGKYNTAPYDKLQMDLMYLAKPSFMEDLRIIFATILILFMRESTEGLSEESETLSKDESA